MLIESSQTCGECLEPLPLSDFGIVRARPSGRNLYCKSCIRAKVKASRQSVKAFVKRKGPVVSGRMQSAHQTASQRIARAIFNGYHSRLEIKRATRMGWDELTEELATLTLERNVLTTRVVEGERRFFFRGAA